MEKTISGRRSILEASYRDVQSSKALLEVYKETGDEYYIETSCYLINQGIEKYMKHILEKRDGSYPRGHDLYKLRRELVNVGEVLGPVLMENFNDIGKWSLTMRYPANYYADIQVLKELIVEMEELVTKEFLEQKNLRTSNVNKTNLFKN